MSEGKEKVGSQGNTDGWQSAVTSLQQRHVTIRSFTNEAVPDELVNVLLRAGRRAPTSSNAQMYSILVIRDPDVKKQLAVLAGNQKHIEVCPVFFAFCADIYRMNKAIEMHDKQLHASLETTLVATVDAALVGMSVQTAVESFGMGAVMIGGMRNHPAEVGKLLNLPKGVFVVFGMAVGWPAVADIPAQKPRLPADVVIHYEQYDAADPTDMLHQYDEELALHYARNQGNQHPAAWSGPFAARLSEPRRPHLRSTLEEMGFKFD